VFSKKKKGGGGGGGGGGNNEMELLKKTFDAQEVKLKEEGKVVDRLGRENVSKVNQINSLEDEIVRNQEKHDAEVDTILLESKSVEDDKAHTIEVLENKVRTLEQHLEAFHVMEDENVSLRDRVSGLLDQLETEGLEHAKDTHILKKEMFNLRMQLEQTFRKSLQELDGQYQKKAFDQMTEESKNALLANAKLKEELALQSVGVENLLQRYKKQEELYMKLKQEKSVLAKTNLLQLNQIAALKRHQYEYESRVSDMQTSMRKMNSNRLDQEKSLEDVPKLVEEADKFRDLHSKSQKRAQKWKTRALELSKTHLEQTKGQFNEESMQARLTLAGVPEVEVRPNNNTISPLRGPPSAAKLSGSTPQQDVRQIWNNSFPNNPGKKSKWSKNSGAVEAATMGAMEGLGYSPASSTSFISKLRPITNSASEPVIARMASSSQSFNFV
jgi:hypothetical protein